MVAPNALVGQVHPFLASTLGAGNRAVSLQNSVLKEGLGLLLPDEQAFFIDNAHERVNVLGLKPPEEIAGGSGIGDTLRPQGVEIVFIVAEQFQVLQAGPAGQNVIGETEHMVRLMVGEVTFEQMEFAVDGVCEMEALDQQQRSAEPTEAAAANFLGDIVYFRRKKRSGIS